MWALWLVAAGLGAKGVGCGGSREPHWETRERGPVPQREGTWQKTRRQLIPEAALLTCEVPLCALSRDRASDTGAESRSATREAGWLAGW